jgi:SpoVK/Ycf46/Vps4 family AAA+-type ATPase
MAAALGARAAEAMAGLAERIESPFGFDDLVLPPATLGQLRDFVSWAAGGAEAAERWGLDAVYGPARGASALFAGPSGSGKTMAAGVSARALGLDLYRVDLAGVVSKYIGETEKNLDRIFAAAARAGAALLFDEADALFGKRSEVSDSHDRYANIEISFLLQRMESHPGVAILATNLRQNMDEAFARRLDAVAEFPAPGPAERLRLWRRLGATDAPLAADVDFALLAERFELTGGSIRTAALAAAQMAASEDAPIAMAHLMRATAHELAKAGKPVRRADFAAYAAAIRPNGPAASPRGASP